MTTTVSVALSDEPAKYNVSANKSRLWLRHTDAPGFEYHAGEVLLFPEYILKAFVDEYG
jgi:hypothetical protein